jgi:hypothetical protein
MRVVLMLAVGLVAGAAAVAAIAGGVAFVRASSGPPGEICATALSAAGGVAGISEVGNVREKGEHSDSALCSLRGDGVAVLVTREELDADAVDADEMVSRICDRFDRSERTVQRSSEKWCTSESSRVEGGGTIHQRVQVSERKAYVRVTISASDHASIDAAALAERLVDAVR